MVKNADVMKKNEILAKKRKRRINNNTLVKHWFPLSFYCSGGSDEFQGREDRLLISHETNINNNNDNNNPTGLSEPIDTNTNPIEEENNRVLSDQSNNMNTNLLFEYNGKVYKTETGMKRAKTHYTKKKIKVK